MSASGVLPERLRQAREEAGLTQQQVADWLSIRRPSVVEMEKGLRGVKSDELVRLANLYGRSIGWLILGEAGPEESITAALFRSGEADDPILRREAAKLAKRCALLEQVTQTAGERHTARAPDYSDPLSLDDYTAAMEHGKSVAYQERRRLGIGESAPLRDPWGIVEDAGLLVFGLMLGKDHPIDGLYTRGRTGRPCVGVNTDKWVFRQVFTVVHEYGHALLDSDIPAETCKTQQAWNGAVHSRRHANRELRSNQFAAVFLVPREALLSFLEARGKVDRRGRATDLSAVEIVRAQDHFGVSGNMLLWRLQNERFIDGAQRKTLHLALLSDGVQALANSLGYDWRRFAQPFGKAREAMLRAYVRGDATIGHVAEVFDSTKEEMREMLHAWDMHQHFRDGDALAGMGT